MSRFNLRRKPRISYYEIEEPNLDEYIYCDECTDFVYEYCAIHGPLLVVPDDKVGSRAGIPPWVPRAALTVPKVFLHIAPSIIPGAGLGIFSTLTLPRGVRFGPYQGKRTDEVRSMYCWQIKSPEQKQLSVVDALDGSSSNWMRYVNCARSWREQNLVAFQYQGQIYYRTVKIIPRFTELLVFYGSEFAHALGIDLRHYNAPPRAQYGAPPAKKPKVEQQAEKTTPVELAQATDENRNKTQKVENESITDLDDKGAPPAKKPKAAKRKPKNIARVKLTTSEVNQTNNTKGVEKANIREAPSAKKPKAAKLKHEKATLVKPAITDENHNKIIQEVEKDNITSLDNKIVQKPVNKNIERNISNDKSMNVYITNHTMKEKIYFECKSCDYQNVTNDSFEKHMRLHDSKKPYECNICQCRFTKVNSGLKIHLIKHTSKQPYECNICHYKFNHKGSLQRHLRTHTGDKPYQCDICQYKCNQKGHLKTHLRTHTGEKPYQCNICQYTCTVKGNLKTHLRTHTGEKPYQCNICQYTCNQKGQLKTHLRTHTGEKPYQCDICQYKCNQKGQLKTHLRTHTGEKPYQCDICQYKCNQKGQLKTHLRTHTGEKPYQCDICQYTCTVKSNLKNHLRTHTGEKPYQCDICERRFNSSRHLKYHLKVHTR